MCTAHAQMRRIDLHIQIGYVVQISTNIVGVVHLLGLEVDLVDLLAAQVNNTIDELVRLVAARLAHGSVRVLRRPASRVSPANINTKNIVRWNRNN